MRLGEVPEQVACAFVGRSAPELTGRKTRTTAQLGAVLPGIVTAAGVAAAAIAVMALRPSLGAVAVGGFAVIAVVAQLVIRDEHTRNQPSSEHIREARRRSRSRAALRP